MENILINYCTYYLAITKRFKMYLIFNKRITVPERKRKDRSVLFMYSKCFSLHVLKGAGITIFCVSIFSGNNASKFFCSLRLCTLFGIKMENFPVIVVFTPNKAQKSEKNSQGWGEFPLEMN